MTAQADLRMLALEITGACQLSCAQCYAGSSPQGTHGAMSVSDWRSVIHQCSGSSTLTQFIGGEPTLHPHLAPLAHYAIEHGSDVEVYTNLLHVTPRLWDLYTTPGVSLATSYYGDGDDFHRVTGGPAKLAQRWWANLETARSLGITVRCGMLYATPEEQERVAALGVRVTTDHVRTVGAVRGNSPDDLCGNCTGEIAAVLPDGSVTPCVMARRHIIGHLKHDTMSSILTGPRRRSVRSHLHDTFSASGMTSCVPWCNPMADCFPRNPSRREASVSSA